MTLQYRRAPGRSDASLIENPDIIPTRRCHSCDAWISDHADECPFCGASNGRTGAWQGRPWWFLAAVIVCVVMVIMWAL